jgi:hypothetical protein
MKTRTGPRRLCPDTAGGIPGLSPPTPEKQEASGGRQATPSQLNRRMMLRAGGVLAGAVAVLRAPVLVRAAEPLSMDMAFDGRTFRLNRLDQGDPTKLPVPGDTFIVFGSLYPAGTIDKGLSGPDQPGAIGRWVCRGTFVVDVNSGAVPHLVSTVLHVLGDSISATTGAIERAPDVIVTEGFEGGYEVARRSIIGGYGRYAGIRGEVVQRLRGQNDTKIALTPGAAVPAPNYSFTFTLASS